MDEVQTGLGRIGTDVWAFQAAEIETDIVTSGKPLGNGYPMSLLMTSSRLLRSMKHLNLAVRKLLILSFSKLKRKFISGNLCTKFHSIGHWERRARCYGRRGSSLK